MARQMHAGENQHKYQVTLSVRNLKTMEFKSITTRYVGSMDIEDKIVDSFLPRFMDIEKRGHKNSSAKRAQ